MPAELGERRARLDLLRASQQFSRGGRKLTCAARVVECRADDGALLVEHDRGLDLRGDLGEIRKGLLGVHRPEA